jgi:UDP-2,3-diacylglucosamine pyrophosphatase LpxH
VRLLADHAQNRAGVWTHNGGDVKPIYRVDQLYVISDLHLGGEPGFQIFGSATELAWLINHLADHDPDAKVALVINGDFIDFLAEAPATYFDPLGAADKLERIVAAFGVVFEALKGFLRKGRRRLIVNLGNHDLELALPWMRERLAQLLTGEGVGSEDARARLHMVFDGSGVLCDVGGRSVLCLHGNEVDRWNPADFEKIRQIGRDVQFGRPIDAWIPNAGSRMVIDVMNRVKRRYPFVDLLKPEVEGVIPTLVACAPDLAGNLEGARKLAGAGLARAWAGVRKPGGMLGAAPGDETEGPAANATLLNEPRPGSMSRASPDARRRELMRAAEAQVRLGVEPMTLVEGVEGQQLDAFGAVVKWYRNESTSEILREALEQLDHDRSFDIGERDDTATQLDAEVSPDIDIVVAGHTHLERALRRQNGSGCYFNSGTWARLIRLDPSVRGDAAKFAKVFDTLRDGRMEQLDAFPGLVEKRCTVAVIWRDGEPGATAELRHVKGVDGATNGELALAVDCPASRMRVP